MKPLDECTLTDSTTALQRLWDVISDEHSVEQMDRQHILLGSFLSATPDRVKVSDLQLMSGVIKFFLKRAEINSHFNKPLQTLIQLLKNPPMMEKSSDELNYSCFIVEYFTTLGLLLLIASNKETQSGILQITQNMFSVERSTKSNLIPVKACIKAIEVSQFMECLADFIAIVEKDLYLLTIYTAFQICWISDLCCWTLLTRNTIETLFIKLNMANDDERPETVDLTYQLLWKLFNCTSHPEDWLKVPTPSRLALRSLRYVLREESLFYTYPGRNTEGLNNIAALTLKMMHLFPNADFLHSGLIEDISFLATLTESVLKVPILPYFRNHQDHLQMKKLMLACLSVSPISNMSVMIFRQYKVAECLVAMLRSNTCVGTESWCPEHKIQLFQLALPVVTVLFECLHQEFTDAGLSKALVTYLKVHYIDEKNVPDDLAHLAIKTVLFLCSRKVNHTANQNALRDAGAIEVLLQLCKIILTPEFTLKMIYQSTISFSLCALTILMENKKEIQNEHFETSFFIVTTLYQRILKPLRTDSITDNRLVVTTANFAWEVLVWNKENILRFISSGNIFSHLDILEKSPFSVQLVYLSMLVDLCEYYQSVPYVVSWRGREGVKLLSVLCRIWRAEEERLRVKRSENGCISDIESPLMGEDQRNLSEKLKKDLSSICDVFGSSRPKIYAIVQLLHRHKEVAELCEEHYKLGYNLIPCEDQITMQLIEAYLPLKMGEIWWEIKNKQELVLPLDRYLAETLADRYLNWSLCVQSSQHDLLKEEDARLRSKEQEDYLKLRSCKLTSALEALREVVTIARTSDRQMLLRSYQRLCQGIEASRAVVDADLKLSYLNDLHIILVDGTIDKVLQSELNSPVSE